MPRLWFAAKRYGYGWYPATWEGWLVIAIHLILILGSIPIFNYELTHGADEWKATAVYLIWVGGLTAILIRICVLKGEKARWRWGK
jgi:hypothetical protein